MTNKPKGKRGPGRLPKAKGEKVNKDGLFDRQWERVKREAKVRHMEPHQFLRWILDDYFGMLDAERSESPATAEDDSNFEELVKSNQT